MDNKPEPSYWQLLCHHLAVIQHKFWVIWYMLKVCWNLMKKALTHDISKFSHHEAPHFALNRTPLSDTTYGDEEYSNMLNEKLQEALNHHYENNRHHPEHYESIEDMPLLRQIEMVVDWRSATRKHDDGNIWSSIEHNKDRFDMPDKMVKRFKLLIQKCGLDDELPDEYLNGEPW